MGKHGEVFLSWVGKVKDKGGGWEIAIHWPNGLALQNFWVKILASEKVYWTLGYSLQQ